MWSSAGLRYAQSDTEELAGLDELEAGFSTTAAGIEERRKVGHHSYSHDSLGRRDTLNILIPFH